MVGNCIVSNEIELNGAAVHSSTESNEAALYRRQKREKKTTR